MTAWSMLLVFAAGMIAAVAFTFVVRRYAVARSILDRPNERSSHEVPTPRGGGLAIAATFLIGALLFWSAGLVPGGVVLALCGGGAFVTLIGWLDDRGGLGTLARFAAHTAAAIWAVACMGGANQLQLGDYTLPLGAAANLIAVIGIVWWINLYNFMDGIDGIAGGQALLVGGAAALLISFSYADPIALLPLLLAGAAAGFLVFNWAPARIFMGDAGSGFLGFVFATLALATEKAGVLPVSYWVLLSGVFVFDATVTLIRRMLRGERWYAAHRSHAYQRAVAAGHSHALVTTAVLLIDTILFVILAAVVAGWLELGPAIGSALALLTITYLLVERASPMAPSRPAAPAASGAGRATGVR